MIKKLHQLFLFFISVGVASLIGFVQVSQAGTSNYYLNPLKMDLFVSSKTNLASSTIQVTSTTNTTMKLKVVPRLWTLTPEGGIQYLEPPQQGFNLLNNIRFNPEEFELKPKQTKTVRFIIKFPPDTPDGEYPLQLFFEPGIVINSEANSTQKNSTDVQQSINIVPIFTTTVYVYKGQVQPNVSIQSFQCHHDPQQGIMTQLNLFNSGLRHARLKGHIILTQASGTNTNTSVIDGFKTKKGALTLVFPNHKMSQTNVLTSEKWNQLPSGQYRLEAQLNDERNEQPAITSQCMINKP